MSAGFPTFPGGPGAAPGGAPGGGFAPPQAGFAPAGFPAGASPYPQAAAPEPAFVLDIPADPTWQPIEGGDTLEKDGFYCAKISGEKVRNDDGKLQVIFTLDLQDDDVVGKKVSKFLPNPTQTTKDTWFLWRGLMRSIYGKVEAGQAALRYTPGMFTGAFVYVKTEAYADSRGTMRTGVGTWSTREEWEEARKTNRHRWPAKVSASQSPGVGALPGGTGGLPGLPGSPGGGLPGLPPVGGGLPGMPNVPTTPGLPMPGTAPMQAVPPQGGFAPPSVTASAPPPSSFGFAPPPAQAAPSPGPAAFPPPPAQNGIPQPTAVGIAGAFPGTTPPR